MFLRIYQVIKSQALYYIYILKFYKKFMESREREEILITNFNQDESKYFLRWTQLLFIQVVLR